jgi:glucose-1-phosphate adenylyltransferase
MRERTLAIILAGGKGSRLEPLTYARAKPAVPFGGSYRIIDFALSNCVNSELFQILVLTQYKSLSVDRHLDLGWKPLFPRELGTFLNVIPPQHQIEGEYYRGTADAVYQNLESILEAQPEDVLILAGDHVYTMDYRTMIEFHRAHRADVTVGTYRVPVAEAAGQFGVIAVDPDQRVIGFQEKPLQPPPIPDDPGFAQASTGIYIFSSRFLVDILRQNAAQNDAGYDFGHDILPRIYPTQRVFAFPFRAPGGEPPYWRDVGTLDAYFQAHQDLLLPDSPFKWRDRRWPLRAFKPNLPPPLLLNTPEGGDSRVANAIVCSASVIQDARVSRSIIGHECLIRPGAVLEDCILLGRVDIGAGARLRRTIVDKDSRLPADCRIGFSLDDDRARGFVVSAGNVTVVPADYGR